VIMATTASVFVNCCARMVISSRSTGPISYGFCTPAAEMAQTAFLVPAFSDE
jgi:hypothetical protein